MSEVNSIDSTCGKFMMSKKSEQNFGVALKAFNKRRSDNNYILYIARYQLTTALCPD